MRIFNYDLYKIENNQLAVWWSYEGISHILFTQDGSKSTRILYDGGDLEETICGLFVPYSIERPGKKEVFCEDCRNTLIMLELAE